MRLPSAACGPATATAPFAACAPPLSAGHEETRKAEALFCWSPYKRQLGRLPSCEVVGPPFWCRLRLGAAASFRPQSGSLHSSTSEACGKVRLPRVDHREEQQAQHASTCFAGVTQKLWPALPPGKQRLCFAGALYKRQLGRLPSCEVVGPPFWCRLRLGAAASFRPQLHSSTSEACGKVRLPRVDHREEQQAQHVELFAEAWRSHCSGNTWAQATLPKFA